MSRDEPPLAAVSRIEAKVGAADGGIVPPRRSNQPAHQLTELLLPSENIIRSSSSSSEAQTSALPIQRLAEWAGLLYGVQPHDTPTFAVTTVALGLIACLACVVPALKAALIDPATALRAQ